jgi:tetratricopeptide (TPR) repeat protein
MPALIFITLLSLLITGCLSDGVTVKKSETMSYLSEKFRKGKLWFKSKDGETYSEDNPPPPPLASQPTTHQPIPAEKLRRMKSFAPAKEVRMNKKDYTRAIERLKKSIPELKSKWGGKHIEVAETYYTMAALYELRQDSQDAVEHYKLALAIFAERLGDKHPRVWSIEKKIAELNIQSPND